MGSVYEFIGNTADGAFVVDRCQTIVLWNRAAASITGHRGEDVLGRKCFAVLRGRDSTECAVCQSGCRAIEAAKHLEPSPTIEMSVETADGSQVWLSLSTILVPSRRSGLSVLVHLFREVTQRHQLITVVQQFAALVAGLAPYTLGPTRTTSGSPLATQLTRREREILAHLALGESTEAIAARLFLSARTVRNHISSVLAKLGVHSRLEAATLAIRNGLV